MKEIELLHEKEAIIPMLQKENLYIIQRADYFNFSLDSILLAEFLTINKSVRKILDLGTGNGAIPLFLSKRTKAKITGVELQEVSYQLAKRNVTLNNLEDQISLIHDNMKNWRNHFLSGHFDAIVCNPPFFKFHGDESQLNDLDQLTLARHEISINLDEIVEVASKLLKDKGYFAMVHRADRTIDIIEAFRKHSIEPKRIRFCHSKDGKPAKTILIEGLKFGSPSLNILPPLFTHKDNGEYSDEVLEFFK